jgi:hypothetical protein
MNGFGENIAVLLEDNLELDLLKRIVKETDRFYNKEENIMGDKFYQVKRKGSLLSLGIPLVVLDYLKDNLHYLEVRRNIFRMGLANNVLSSYFTQLYGKFGFKK